MTQFGRRAWQDLPWWTKPIIPLSILVYGIEALEATTALGPLERALGFLGGVNILLVILVFFLYHRLVELQSTLEESQRNEEYPS